MKNSLDNELKEIEAQLAEITPTQMPKDMISRMEQAMIAWEVHLPVEEKIVPFNQLETATPDPSQKPRINHLQRWGAAAAIALFTSTAAIFTLTNDQPIPNLVGSQNTSASPSSAVPVDDRVTTNLTPLLSRNITHASNEGITYAGKNEAPFKVLRIEYNETVISYNKDGKTMITENPCVEHILIPVPVH